MPSNLRRAQDEYAEWKTTAGSRGELLYAGTVEDAVQDADLAIDFVPDELESKLEIFSLLDRMAPPRTILCTPTRALSITDLASCTYRPARCIGVRTAGRDLLTGEIEVVRSKFATAEAIAAVGEVLTAMNLTWREVEDTEEPMLVKNVLE